MALSGNGIKVDLKGDKEIKRLLDTLPSRVIKKGMRAAQMKAARPMLASAKSRVAKRSGLLRRSLKIKQKTYASGKVITIIGPDRGVSAAVSHPKGGTKPKTAIPANYSHLVEKGHSGKRPAPPHRFLKPAYDENVAKGNDAMRQTLLDTLYREADKLKGK
jgi:HK97 gp10 family phage protein